MSEPHWSEAAQALLDAGENLAMATIAAVSGSAPREAGVRMLVTRTQVIGTIGGGALEWNVVEQARRLLDQDAKRALAQDYPLGPLLAQCCGGYVRMLIERFDARDRDWITEVAACERRGGDYTISVQLDGEGGVAHACAPHWPALAQAPGVWLFDADGVSAAKTVFGAVGRKRAWRELIEYVRPAGRRVYLFGAGHVGQALAPILRVLPLDLHWSDARAECEGATFEPEPIAVVRAAPPGSLFVIMTHSHDLDFKLTQAVLARRDALYCGLIGSKTKRARFLRRLAESGLEANALERLTCPLGAIGLKGKQPAVIAVAAAAEIMMRIEANEDLSMPVAEGVTA